MGDAIALWLKQAGRYPLLTASEEIELSRSVQAWLTSPNPSPQVTAAGRRARERLVCCNLRLVVSIAKKYMARTQLGLDDLLQAGAMGLCRATELFDPSQGYKFSTYAYWWIRQGVTRTIGAESPDRAARLPVHVTEKLSKLRRAIAAFTQQHGRGPNAAEQSAIRSELSISGDTWGAMQPWLSPSPSLDALIGGDGETPLLSLIPSPSPDPYTALEGDEVNQAVERLLSCLNERERRCLRLRHGLETGQPQHLDAIAQAEGISRERVRQILNKATQRIRRQLEREATAQQENQAA